EIHSFKMELKGDVSWIAGEDIRIEFSMVAPEEVDASLVDEAIDPRERAAWNSFAIATDEGQPVEPERVGVYMALDNVVTLEKKGEDGELLEGALFNLEDEAGHVIEEGLATNEEGLLVIENIMPGAYQLVETEAPEGYVLDETPIPFTVTSAQEIIELDFENPLQTGDVELIKVNEDGDVLEGAVFQLEDEEGNV